MNDAIRVVGGLPDDDETAAIAAVLTQLRLERATSTLPLPPSGPEGPSAWSRSARALREPLPRRTWQSR